MQNKGSVAHKLKNDKYVRVRGGNSHFLDVYCSKCKTHLLLYQKDGQGALIRLYLDRIFAPKKLFELQFVVWGKGDMPNLVCTKCNSLVGTPMVYDPEKRFAFRLLRGSFSKEKSEGVYPPSQ